MASPEPAVRTRPAPDAATAMHLLRPDESRAEARAAPGGHTSPAPAHTQPTAGRVSPASGRLTGAGAVMWESPRARRSPRARAAASPQQVLASATPADTAPRVSPRIGVPDRPGYVDAALFEGQEEELVERVEFVDNAWVYTTHTHRERDRHTHTERQRDRVCVCVCVSHSARSPCPDCI